MQSTLLSVQRSTICVLSVFRFDDLGFTNKGILPGDGVHPNGNGSKLIADIVSRGIYESLSR